MVMGVVNRQKITFSEVLCSCVWSRSALSSFPPRQPSCLIKVTLHTPLHQAPPSCWKPGAAFVLAVRHLNSPDWTLEVLLSRPYPGDACLIVLSHFSLIPSFLSFLHSLFVLYFPLFLLFTFYSFCPSLFLFALLDIVSWQVLQVLMRIIL